MLSITSGTSLLRIRTYHETGILSILTGFSIFSKTIPGSLFLKTANFWTLCLTTFRKFVIYFLGIFQASNVARENLISLGTCFGKFTKTKKFRLHITALDFLAPYATNKIWLKTSAEQQFLYGHNVAKAGLGRITEDTDKYQGVVVYSMGDLPIGFGVAARSTAECRHADPMTVVCFHQADIGEYIRAEDTLT